MNSSGGKDREKLPSSEPDEPPPAPGRERAWAALDASHWFLPIPGWDSLPVPVKWKDGLAISVLLGVPAKDDDRGPRSREPHSYCTVSLSAPWMREERGLPGQPARVPTFAGHAYSDQFLSLLPRHKQALRMEYFELCDFVGTAWIDGTLSEEDRDNARRLHHLLHFSMSEKLFRFLEMLSPDFFRWLSDVTGEHFGKPVCDPPDAREDCDLMGPPRSLERPSADRNREKTPDPPPPYSITDDEVLAACRKFDLTPGAHSPLAAMPASGRDADLSKKIPEESAKIWGDALDTLCDPQWLAIENVLARNGCVLQFPYCVPARERDGIWVGYKRRSGGMHRLDFPVYPETSIRRARYLVEPEDLPGGSVGPLQLSAQELAVFVSMAEALSHKSDKTAPFTPNDLRVAWMRPSPDQGMRWPYVARVFSPLPVPAGEDPIPGGIAQLLMRGLLGGTPARPCAGRQMASLLDATGNPRAGHGLVVRRLDDETQLTAGGFSVIRSEKFLWVWEVPALNLPGRPPGEPRLHLYAVSPRQWQCLMEDYFEAACFTSVIQRPDEAWKLTTPEARGRALIRTKAGFHCKHCGEPVPKSTPDCEKCGYPLVR